MSTLKKMVIWLLLNSYDYFITYKTLEKGGIEANPLIAPIIHTSGSSILKLLIAPLFVLLCLSSLEEKRKQRVLTIALVIYSLVAINNTIVYLVSYFGTATTQMLQSTL